MTSREKRALQPPLLSGFVRLAQLKRQGILPKYIGWLTMVVACCFFVMGCADVALGRRSGFLAYTNVVFTPLWIAVTVMQFFKIRRGG